MGLHHSFSMAIIAGAAMSSLVPSSAAGFYSDKFQDAGGTIATAAVPAGLTLNTTTNLSFYFDNNTDVDFIKVNIPDPSKFAVFVLNGPIGYKFSMFHLNGQGIHASEHVTTHMWYDTDAVRALPAGNYVFAVSPWGWDPKTHSGQNIFKHDPFYYPEYIPQTSDPLDHFDGPAPGIDHIFPAGITIHGVQSIVPTPEFASVALFGLALARRQR